MNNRSNTSWLLCLLIMTGLTVRAGDVVTFVILRKGSAQVYVEKTKKSIELRQGRREALPEKATLSIEANSSAIVYNRNGSTEVGGTRPEQYKTNLIISTLNQKVRTAAFMRFYDFLNRTYSGMHESEALRGSVPGAASRSIHDHEFLYWPNDSTIVTSDSVELIWSRDNYFTLTKNLLVMNTTTGDTVYHAFPENPCIELVGLNEGEYHWLGMIRTEDGDNYSMNNIFIVPPPERRDSLRKELLQFSRTISEFSPETRTALMNEYLVQNRIYFRIKSLAP